MKKVNYTTPEIDVYYSTGEEDKIQYLKCSYINVPYHIENLIYDEMFIYLGTQELTSFDKDTYEKNPLDILEEIGESLKDKGYEIAADFFLHYFSTADIGESLDR